MTDYCTVIDRARRMQKFQVKVTVPNHFRFTGRAPYHMNIVGNRAVVTVLALTIEEAGKKANAFFQNTP